MGPLDDLEMLGAFDVEIAPGLRHVELYTMSGLITLLWHGAKDAHDVVVMGGGAMGGLLGPAGGLFHHLGVSLAALGYGAIRVGYRTPNDLMRCVRDMGAAAQIAYSEGANRFVTMGHSFGGAVALNVAVALPDYVRGVVTFSTQSAGCEVAEQLRDDVPLLLFHGDHDELLPVVCSETVRMMAGHGELVVLPGKGHALAGAGPALLDRLLAWLPGVFGEEGGEGAEGAAPV